MELTTRGRYAVMAMADLARLDGTRAYPLSQIADNQKLPLSYLEQLFLNLRRAGLVESVRGRSGGYRLAHPAGEISVADIMAAVRETHFTRCKNEEAAGCLAGERCVTHELWKGLSEVTVSYLKSVSLGDLIAGRTARGAVSPATASSQPPRRYLDYNATAPLLPSAPQGDDGRARVCGQSLVGPRGRAPSSWHRRDGARAGSSAHQGQALGDRIHERRNGSERLGDGAGL